MSIVRLNSLGLVPGFKPRFNYGVKLTNSGLDVSVVSRKLHEVHKVKEEGGWVRLLVVLVQPGNEGARFGTASLLTGDPSVVAHRAHPVIQSLEGNAGVQPAGYDVMEPLIPHEGAGEAQARGRVAEQWQSVPAGGLVLVAQNVSIVELESSQQVGKAVQRALAVAVRNRFVQHILIVEVLHEGIGCGFDISFLGVVGVQDLFSAVANL